MQSSLAKHPALEFCRGLHEKPS